MLNKVKFSVIIPTRERADTLKYTIKSALNQSTNEFEVLVSDNFSSDNTKSIIDEFHDPRLRYINPGKRLSMTDHWNFAITHAKGDYLIIIGDDDALMPNSIDRFCDYLDKFPSLIYTWPTNVYFWPTDSCKAKIHHLIIDSIPIKKDLTETVETAVRFGLCNYLKLPHLYHSAVHRSVLDKIYKVTGSYFKTTIPDVYMSYVLPVFCRNFIDLGESVTVIGHSPKSNSGSLINDKNGTELNLFFNEYGEYQINKNIPLGLSKTASFILDTIFVARELFPNYYKKIKPNNSAMLAFLCFSLSLDSVMSVLRNKKISKSAYNYSFIMFLFYLGLFKMNVAIKGFRMRPKSNAFDDAPSNIYDFVLNVKL